MAISSDPFGTVHPPRPTGADRVRPAPGGRGRAPGGAPPSNPGQATDPTERAEPPSPLLRRLAGDPALWALPRPLVEPAPDRPGHSLVTFLWRGRPVAEAEPDDDVYVLINRLTVRDDLDASKLVHLPGTDVWWRSWTMRDDWLATYHLAPSRRPAELPVDPAASSRGTAAGPWRLAGTGAVPTPGAGADAAIANATTDPGNPATLPSRWGGPVMSVVALPAAPTDPAWEELPPPERTSCDELAGPAVAGAAGPLRLWWRAPATTEPCDLLIVLDGQFWGPLHGLGAAAGRLEAAGEARPTAVVMVDSVDDDVRRRHYTCDPVVVDWLADDVVAWARARWPIAEGPGAVAVAGQSLGGLMALAVGHRRPDAVGRVWAQSPSLWWPGGSEFDAEAGSIIRDIAAGGPRSMAVDLAVGLQEPVLLPWARHLRDVLVAAGHPIHYAEHNGGHDFVWWRFELTAALRRRARRS